MQTVNILRRAPGKAEIEMKPMRVFHTAGPWVVTPSDDADCPGFAVTFTTSGKKAWPNQPGPAALPTATRIANELFALWPHPHEDFTGIEKDRLVNVVRPQ